MSDTKVGYIFTLNYALGQDKNISVNGNFAMDDSSEEMSKKLDTVFAACEKQRIKRMELPTAEQALEDQKARLDDEKKSLAKLAGKMKLSSSEQSQASTHNSTIERLEEVIPKGEAFVAELRLKAA